MTPVSADACPKSTVKKGENKQTPSESFVKQPALDHDNCNLIIDDFGDEFIDLDSESMHVQAYSQGRFDHFCGIYAIINALRLAKYKCNTELYVDWSKVFAAIISHIDQAALMRKVTLEGLTREEHQSCLRAASDYLSRRYDLSVSWSWPLSSRKSMSKSKILANLSKHLDERGTSVILHFVHWGQTHWTVLEEVSLNSLCLADSAKVTKIRIRDLRFTKAKAQPITNCYSLNQHGVLTITISEGATITCNEAPSTHV